MARVVLTGCRMASGTGEASIVVGLDLVLISAITSSIGHFGARFLRRIFTPGEIGYCLLDPDASAMRFAARFAAKEAALKVLRFEDEAVSWRSIEIERSSRGTPALLLHNEARARALDGEFIGFSVSLTHEGDYASAVVIGERRLPGRNE